MPNLTTIKRFWADTPTRERVLNQALDTLFDVWLPIAYRLIMIAVGVFAFIGVIMATGYFYQVHPEVLGQPPTWSTAYEQAEIMLSWPVTVAPLWWKLSFFIMGGLVLFPRLLTIRD